MRTPSARCFAQTCDIHRATIATSARNEITWPIAGSATYTAVPCSLQLDVAGETNDLMKETLNETGLLCLPDSFNGSAVSLLISDFVLLTGESAIYQVQGKPTIPSGRSGMQSVRVERVGYQR